MSISLIKYTLIALQYVTPLNALHNMRTYNKYLLFGLVKNKWSLQAGYIDYN